MDILCAALIATPDEKFVPNWQTPMASAHLTFWVKNASQRMMIAKQILCNRLIVKYWLLNIITHKNTLLFVVSISKEQGQ